jgi:hypothetical protein
MLAQTESPYPGETPFEVPATVTSLGIDAVGRAGNPPASSVPARSGLAVVCGSGGTTAGTRP